MMMHYVAWGMALVAAVTVALLIRMYNCLVRIGNCCSESWADVETELQRRHDLIPKLVSTVQGYAAHERQLLENVSRIREECMAFHGSVRERGNLETRLKDELRGLKARVEAYPDLKANRNFLELQKELALTEDRIQAARRFYNGNVRDNNNLVQTFPSNVMAILFRFKDREFFELTEIEAADAPKLSLV
ncbi:MAG: LemA family protein [FCB group bacterium]|jgi:LemA protein|nr:LemA family protein [FCB group bacterium]